MINQLLALLQQLEEAEEHVFQPVNGFPILLDGLTIPSDLAIFYQRYGGAHLFYDKAFDAKISSPEEFVPINTIFFEELPESELAKTLDDESWKWYRVATYPNSMYIIVNLAVDNYGMYFHTDFFAHPHDAIIVASNFLDLLEKIIMAKGDIEFWAE
jgi:antitoxin YokJ